MALVGDEGVKLLAGDVISFQTQHWEKVTPELYVGNADLDVNTAVQDCNWSMQIPKAITLYSEAN